MNLEDIKGIGTTTIKYLNELGIYNIDDLINEIIKANGNVKNSSSNNDWRLFGEDMQTLTGLIDQLENAVSAQETNAVANETEMQNEVVNETVNNTAE